MQTRTAVLVFAIVSLTAAPLAAQAPQTSPPSTPRFEVFAGYEQPAKGDGHMRFGMGWNVNDRVALVVSGLSLGFATSPTQGTSTFYGFLVGPRLRFRQQHRVMPFAEFLVGMEGGARRGTAFETAVGAGFDLRLDDRFAWRVVQVEERSRFGEPDADHRLAVSSGLVIRFGARR